jgi:hypothetical protein
MDLPAGYSRRGGARVGYRSGSWPFGKIEIAGGFVTVSVLGGRRTLGVADVLRVEPLGAFSTDGGPGVRIFFRGKHWEEHVDFYSMTGRAEIMAELRAAGFNVVEKTGS